MQIDLLPYQQPSWGYNCVSTALDVLSRYLFAYRIVEAIATSSAKVSIEYITKHSIRQFEENLTKRLRKKTIFSVQRYPQKWVFGWHCRSGIGGIALAVFADKEELFDSKEGNIGNLFEGVWDAADIVLGSDESADVHCVKVLRNWYSNLFDKDNPKQIGFGDEFISAYDACELLGHNLGQCGYV